MRICAIVILAALAVVFLSGGAFAKPSAPPANPRAGQTWKSADGSVMIYVPAGEFTMGGSYFDCPKHKHKVGGYWIDKYEVTNAQFLKFARSTHCVIENACTDQSQIKADNRPIIGISWRDACAYAKWAGKRLPTEAEWERAARGTDGRIYPWGNKWDPNKAALNRAKWDDVDPVGSNSGDRSPVGCYDMAGNAVEWCLDRYDTTGYRAYMKGKPRAMALGFIYCTRGAGAAQGKNEAVTFSRGWGMPNYFRPGLRCVIGKAPSIKPLDFDYGCEANKTPRIYRTPAPPAKPKPGDVWICPKNGAEMVYVPAGPYNTSIHFVSSEKDIPKGSTDSYFYGNTVSFGQRSITSPGSGPHAAVTPEKKIVTGAFWISRYPITRMQYRQFIKATGYRPIPTYGGYDTPGRGYFPAMGLAREDAAAYAKWLGQRLPDIREWEKAGRGTDRRIYPWGSKWIPYAFIGFSFKYMDSDPIGSNPFTRSPYGVWDMATRNMEFADPPGAARSGKPIDECFLISGGFGVGPHVSVPVEYVLRCNQLGITRIYQDPRSYPLNNPFRCLLEAK